jgi:hypothetical protein
VFAAVGVACGLLGATFNHLNEKLTVIRNKTLTTKGLRFAEALVMAGITAFLCMIIPFALPCVDTPPPPAGKPADALALAEGLGHGVVASSRRAGGGRWTYEPNALQVPQKSPTTSKRALLTPGALQEAMNAIVCRKRALPQPKEPY